MNLCVDWPACVIRTGDSAFSKQNSLYKRWGRKVLHIEQTTMRANDYWSLDLSMISLEWHTIAALIHLEVPKRSVDRFWREYWQDLAARIPHWSLWPERRWNDDCRHQFHQQSNRSAKIGRRRWNSNHVWGKIIPKRRVNCRSIGMNNHWHPHRDNHKPPSLKLNIRRLPPLLFANLYKNHIHLPCRSTLIISQWITIRYVVLICSINAHWSVRVECLFTLATVQWATRTQRRAQAQMKTRLQTPCCNIRRKSNKTVCDIDGAYRTCGRTR